MDLKKYLVYGSGLVLATTGPISVCTTSNMVADAKKGWFSPPAATVPAGQVQTPVAGVSDPAAAPNHAPAAAIPSSSPVSGTPIPTLSMADAFNFDVTIDGIMQRWPRVTTGLVYVQMQGYRVPLVTGTTPGDLAGSLTYYFDPTQRVGRITFRGVTGDASGLIALLSTRFQFTRRMTNDPGLILYESADSSNRLTGVARIRSARIIRASEPYSHFDVEVVINRPVE
jgi:hypothetical protein